MAAASSSQGQQAGGQQGLPRLLDVQLFTNARDAEVQALHGALGLDQLLPATASNQGVTVARGEADDVAVAGGSGRRGAGPNPLAVLLLPRHLRRRATSHNRRIARRRPNLRLAALALGSAAATAPATATMTNGSSHSSKRQKPSSVPPPGTAAGADVCGAGKGAMGLAALGAARPMSRAMRRRASKVQRMVEASCQAWGGPNPSPAGDGLQPGSQVDDVMEGVEERGEDVDHIIAAGPGPGSGSGSGLGPVGRPRRLETHVWHARRMKLHVRWGHMLALQAPGRGRGSRSLLHAARQGASLLHDASYWGVLQLQGVSRGAVLEVLRQVCDPSELQAQQQQQKAARAVWEGAAEWSIKIHRRGQWPWGALGPARALWIPGLDLDPNAVSGDPECVNRGANAMEVNPSGAAAAAAGSAGGGHGDGGENNACGPCRLWLWVHAAALEATTATLLEACDAVNAGITAPATASSLPQSPPPEPHHQGQGQIQPVSSTPAATHAMVPKPQAPRVVLTPLAHALRRMELWGPGAEAALRLALGSPVATASTCGTASVDAAAAGGGSMASGSGGNRGDVAARLWRAAWAQRPPGRVVRWPPGAVLGLTVSDPHLAAPVRVGAVEALVSSHTGGGGAAAAGAAGVPDVAASTMTMSWGEVERQLWGWPLAADWTEGAHALLHHRCPPPPQAVGSGTAVAVATGSQQPSSQHPAASPPAPCFAHLLAPPPLPDHVISSLRHHTRRAALQLQPLQPTAVAGAPLPRATAAARAASAEGGTWPRPLCESALQGALGGGGYSRRLLMDGRNTAAATAACGELQQQEAMDCIDEGRPATATATVTATASAATATATASTTCPVLLVRQAGLRGGSGSSWGPATAGWSLIVPAGWAMPMWLQLVRSGARPAGQREWRWLAAALGLPCFPYDFPHTEAGHATSAQLATEQAEHDSRRPQGRQAPPAHASATIRWESLLGPEWSGGAGPVGGSPSAATCCATDTRATTTERLSSSGTGAGAAAGSGVGATSSVTIPTSAPGPGRFMRVAHSQPQLWRLLSGSSSHQLLLQQQQVLGRPAHQQQPQAASQTPRHKPRTQARSQGAPAHDVPLSIAKAVATGRLAWRPKAAAPSSQPAAQAAVAAPAAAGVPGSAPTLVAGPQVAAAAHSLEVQTQARGQEQTPPGIVAVVVRLRVLGKGVCREGAEILAPPPCPSSIHPPCAPSGSRGASTSGSSSDIESGSSSLLGFVTSSEPRGSPGYPGGLGICDARRLLAVASRMYYSSGSSSGGWGGSSWARRLRVMIRNPGSGALRSGELQVVVVPGGDEAAVAGPLHWL